MRYLFTGDRKVLKKNGFTYYGNFYSNDVIDLVLVNRKEMYIRISELDSKIQKQFIDFILENKEESKEFWVKDIIYENPYLKLSDMPIYCLNSSGVVLNVDTFYEYNQESKEALKELITQNPEEERKIRKEFYKNDEFIKDPVYFGLELVSAIIDIDNIHKLELKN